MGSIMSIALSKHLIEQNKKKYHIFEPREELQNSSNASVEEPLLGKN